MNPIELEWEHLKRDELAGQMFESESELAYCVLWDSMRDENAMDMK